MIRYALSGAAGLSAAAAVSWLAIPSHPPPPSPPVRDEEPYRKGDRLPIHRPAPEVTEAPAPVVMDAEPAPPPPRKKNVCEQNGGTKIDRGRSWHCQYPKRRK
jgi:hypothetical protein